MRIAFAGTPEAAVPTLRALFESAHDVAFVVTRPDAPVGRGQVMTPSPIAEVAHEFGCRTIKPAKLVDIKDEFADIDCVVVVAYGNLVPRELLDVPTHGWINVHFSLLPHWRGAAPVQHAIMGGDDITGVSTFRIDEGLDTGPMLAYLTTSIGERETSSELLERLSREGGALALATLLGLENGSMHPLNQPLDGVSFAPKITVSDARVNWHHPALAVNRHIRAVTSEPGAWTMCGETRIKLGPVHVRNDIDNIAVGVVLAHEKKVLVGTGSCAVELNTVQEAGRKPVDAVVWFNNRRELTVFE